MKLDVLNIVGVENTWTWKQKIETHTISNFVENPKNDSFSLEFGNVNMEKELKKHQKFAQIVRNVELFAIMLAM